MAALNKNLVRGSFILLLSFGLFNFFHFLFQFLMARMLSVSDYGVLAVLFAIIYIFALFTESIQIIITKYSAKENDKGKLKNIFIKSKKKGMLIALILFILYLIISLPLSFILNINYLLLATNGIVIFFAFLLPVARGIMQGKERFKSLGANMMLESCSKLLIGIFLVYFGWKVYGAILGVILGGIIAFMFSLFEIKDIIDSKEKTADTFGINNYASSAFLITAIITIFYSLDVILARVFFTSEIAGTYAIASVLGKIIFWGTLPISKAMFPMASQNSLDKKKSESLFLNALAILVCGAMIVLTAFYLFPEFIIRIFSGRILPESSSILFYLGIAFGLISIANLTLLYKLSLGKVKGHLYLFVFIILEILLLSYFSKNILQYSIAFITASAAFLWGVIMFMKE